MHKYTEQFKLKVVKDYLSGTKGGYRRISVLHDVATPYIRQWVSLYRWHGKNGLRRKVGRYSPEFRMSVLEHMWENGLSHRQAAAQFNIRNPTSVASWEERHHRGGQEALAARRPRSKMKAPLPKPTQKPDEELTYEELLKRNAYLRMENEVLKKLQALAQARKARESKRRK